MPLRHALLRIGWGLGTTISVAFAWIVACALLRNGSDILRAYPSPERHEGVREISRADPKRDGAHLECLVGTGDFDGDGADDSLDVEYFHMEPLFRAATSGMVFVRSGRDGTPLLAHAVPTPFTHACWLGDLDGNGTDDIEIDDGARVVRLGFVAE
ncbi:MAG TPA: hypothetical protein VMS76_00495 [Planctomycetota bacterium]|nr:hypothetical protein [Planctomycetota bacterium]